MRNINFRVFPARDLLIPLTGLLIASTVAFIPRSAAQVVARPPAPPARTTTPLRFEVASIRPVSEEDLSARRRARTSARASGQPTHLDTTIDGSRVDIGAATLLQLITTAYSARGIHVEGPDWLQSERFDIHAQLPLGATKEQLPELLQAFLEERFKLAAHRATDMEPIYALIVGPKGPRLDPAISDEEVGHNDKDGKPNNGNLRDGSGGLASVSIGPDGAQLISVSGDGLMREEYSRTTTKALAEHLRFLGRPVIDMTGLQGTYHVVLNFSQNDALRKIDTSTNNDPNPSIFSAIEKLGLKLESRKAPIERIVIDHIDKQPTEN